MATINYTVNTDSPNSIPGVETLSQKDLQLLNTFEINSTFNPTQHTVELHITDLFGNILTSDYNYINYKLLGNAQSADTSGARIITVNPLDDIKSYGFEIGGVKLLYHLYDNIYSTDRSKVEFFIDSISTDRTELLLDSLQIPQERLESTTTRLREKLNSTSFFQEYRLNFENNDLFIITNIDLLQVGDTKKVAVKLYEPLPSIYSERDILSLIELVGDSFAFEITSTVELEQPTIPTLREANFNIDATDVNLTPSPYLNYNELFSYNIGSSTNEIFSKLNQLGVNVSIDHTDYSDFIYFSSAEERLLNFKYKLELLEGYNTNIQALEQGTAQSISGSLTYYKGLVEGVLRNFDHYDSYLYYESGSSAWPKTDSQRPYTNAAVNSSEGITWFSQQRAIASAYDKSNLASLENTIPNYLRDDEANASYITFVSMIGQHFDSLWLYTKSVTDKYDADNRLDFGISKDLVEEALRNFGVKIYNSSKSSEDLLNSLFSQTYNSGSELITNYITGSLTGSNTPIFSTSFDNYQKEIYKRLYHNLSYLVKTKGTERGVRALINCFGIPSDILTIKTFGGRNRENLPFFGNSMYSTSSLDKIRLDNTGSIITGSILSQYTSTVKPEDKYTDDLHAVEIGFSPTTNTDNYILSQIDSSFNIDQLIGDPSLLYEDSYDVLNNFTQELLQDLTRYDVKDFVRLIKFFDNVIFKLVKDFLPARVSKSTGVVIKPHILSRSKIKSPKELGNFEYLEGSILIGSRTGSHGSSFGSRDQYSTNYQQIVQTPGGLRLTDKFIHQEAKYNGEFSGSLIRVTDGELNTENPVKFNLPGDSQYNILFISGSDEVCLIFGKSPTPSTKFWVQPGIAYQLDTFFTGPIIGIPVSASVAESVIETIITPSHTFSAPTYTNYDNITLEIVKEDLLVECSASVELLYATCSLMVRPGQGSVLLPQQTISFTSPVDGIFTNSNNQDIQRQVSIGTGTFQNVPDNADQYTVPFDLLTGDTITFRISDTVLNGIGATCAVQKQYTINEFCDLGIIGLSSRNYSKASQTTVSTLFINQPTDVIYLIQVWSGFSWINIDNTLTGGTPPGLEFPVDESTVITLSQSPPPLVVWSWTISGPQFNLPSTSYYYTNPSNVNFIFNDFSKFRVVAKSQNDVPDCEQAVEFGKPIELVAGNIECELVCALYESGQVTGNLGEFAFLTPGQYYLFRQEQTVFSPISQTGLVYSSNAVNQISTCLDTPGSPYLTLCTPF